jgi:hypothetical protein
LKSPQKITSFSIKFKKKSSLFGEKFPVKKNGLLVCHLMALLFMASSNQQTFKLRQIPSIFSQKNIK